MDININQLSNDTIATQILELQELIDDIEIELNQQNIVTSWQKQNKVSGYYFNIFNPSNKKDCISFGVWLPLWAVSKTPLSLSFEVNSVNTSDLLNMLSNFISDNELKSIQIIEYSDVINICFFEEYLISLKYSKALSDLIISILNLLRFEIKINKKKW